MQMLTLLKLMILKTDFIEQQYNMEWNKLRDDLSLCWVKMHFLLCLQQRVPSYLPPVGGMPILIIYQDTDTILRKACCLENITINGRRLLLYLDFSAEVQIKMAKQYMQNL